MKRLTPFQPEYSFRPIFPLFFWKQCFHCDQQFRREWGWEHMISADFICKECAPNTEDASNKFSCYLTIPIPPGPE